MARFLICTMPAAGHVHPALPIARALINGGHDVWWYTGRRFQEAIEQTGAHYTAMQAAPDVEGRDPNEKQRSGLDGFKWDVKHLFYDPMAGQIADLKRILREFPADVILSDTAFVGAGALHELGEGPPWATYGMTALTLNSRDTAPFGTALPPNASPLGRLRNRMLAGFFNHVLFRDVTTYANQTRAKLRLPPLVGSVLDQMSPYMYLQSSTPAFEYPRSDLPPQVHFIGPLLPEPGEHFTPPEWWPELHGGRPVVLVTQGTVATDSEELIAPTLRALADKDVLVIATTGGKSVDSIKLNRSADEAAQQAYIPSMSTPLGGVLGSYVSIPGTQITLPPTGEHERNPFPANARVEQFVPFAQLMPHISVMITNGGYGGVQFALAHGIPVIVAGTTEEKPEIAARVAWSGAGINLKTATPTPEQIRTAVQDMLSNPSYRAQAQRIRADYRGHNAPLEAVRLLEKLAATKRPVLAESAPIERRGYETKVIDVRNS